MEKRKAVAEERVEATAPQGGCNESCRAGSNRSPTQAWFGWTSISQAQVYMKAADRKLMAKGAAKLISGTGIGSPSDPVSQNADQMKT
jgi:hypothetical protein